MDTVLPPPGAVPVLEEALLRVRDLTMMQALNSLERELADFERLFALACDDDGGRLMLKNVIKPPGSMMSIMEVVYVSNTEERNESTASGIHANGIS